MWNVYRVLLSFPVLFIFIASVCSLFFQQYTKVPRYDHITFGIFRLSPLSLYFSPPFFSALVSSSTFGSPNTCVTAPTRPSPRSRSLQPSRDVIPRRKQQQQPGHPGPVRNPSGRLSITESALHLWQPDAISPGEFALGAHRDTSASPIPTRRTVPPLVSQAVARPAIRPRPWTVTRSSGTVGVPVVAAPPATAARHSQRRAGHRRHCDDAP